MTPEIWVLLIGAVLGTGGIAAGIQAFTGRGRTKAEEHNIAAETAAMVVTMVREEIEAKDDELEAVKLELESIHATIRNLKRQLKHWRKVADRAAKDFRDRHGEEPEWHTPFEE